MDDALIIDLDDDVIDRLRVRAARNRRSFEEEVVVILTDLAHEEEAGRDLVGELRRAFAEAGGVELDIPPRSEMTRVVDLPE